MDMKIRFSKATITAFEDCKQELEAWGFDSINLPVLMENLLRAPDNLLYDYIESHTKNDYMEVDVLASTAVGEYYDKLKKEAKKKEADKQKKEEKKQSNSGKKKKRNQTKSSKDGEEKAQKPTKLLPQKSCDLTFLDPDDVKFTYPCDSVIEKIIEHLTKLCQEKGIALVTPIHIIVAAFDLDLHEMKDFMGSAKVDYYGAKREFKVEDIMKLGIIPYILAGFLSNFNEKVDADKPCQILMRDKEAKRLWNIMGKANKRNAILTGEAGVGKSAIMEKIAYDIVTKNCPEKFKDFVVIKLDINSLIAGTTYRGQAEERIKDTIEFLEKHHNVILFIDEVHTMLGAGSCFEGEMDLANAMKPILARGDTIVIGATTTEEYEKYFQKDAALARRFEEVVIKEPGVDKVYPMIKNKIDTYSQFHKVTISEETVQYAIMIAGCFTYHTKNPDRTLDLIDRAMAAAADNGHKEVTKEDVYSCFDMYTEMWEKASDETRIEIASHEMGHFVVGRFSGRLTDIKTLAVSIMPAKGYLGVNVIEDDEDAIPHANFDFYIDLMAYYIGGRVGEEMYTKDITSGARSDLDIANGIAYRMLTEYGFTASEEESISKNRTYLSPEEYPIFSEKIANQIDEGMSKLIDKATKRATELLKENSDVLDYLVKQVLEKKIMDIDQINKAIDEVVAKRSIA